MGKIMRQSKPRISSIKVRQRHNRMYGKTECGFVRDELWTHKLYIQGRHGFGIQSLHLRSKFRSTACCRKKQRHVRTYTWVRWCSVLKGFKSLMHARVQTTILPEPLTVVAKLRETHASSAHHKTLQRQQPCRCGQCIGRRCLGYGTAGLRVARAHQC
jgi:hypothetical protein